MNIIGSIYVVDEPHLDVLKNTLSSTPPPGGGAVAGSTLCVDLDETDNMIEVWFPNHAQKGTLLCPPPIAMYKEIDGDMEGFISEYFNYLKHEESVQDFIASMMLLLHLGGNIIIYTPSHLEDDAIWMNNLIMFFFTEFGITIGTPTTVAEYDSKYDSSNATFMYSRGVMDVFDYIMSTQDMTPPWYVHDRIIMDLLPLCSKEENPIHKFEEIKALQMMGYTPFKPSVIFDR